MYYRIHRFDSHLQISHAHDNTDNYASKRLDSGPTTWIQIRVSIFHNLSRVPEIIVVSSETVCEQFFS